MWESWCWETPGTTRRRWTRRRPGRCRRAKGLKLRFAKGVSRDLDVELLSVSEPEGGRVTVVFRGDTYLPELTLLRQQSAEVIRRTTEGIRVPIEAVRLRERTVTDEDGAETLVRETGVYCIVGMEARFKPVEVLYSGEDFALVRSTLDTAEDSPRRRRRSACGRGTRSSSPPRTCMTERP